MPAPQAPQAQEPDEGKQILSIIKLLLKGGKDAKAIADMTGLPLPPVSGDLFSWMSSVLGLAGGLYSGDPMKAVSGALGTGSQVANLLGAGGAGSLLGAAGGPLNLVGGILHDNPASMASGALQTAGTVGPMLGEMAGMAPIVGLSSVVAPIAGILAASLPGGIGDMIKDAERRKNEQHEYHTAERDLPTTLAQQQGALKAHDRLGGDLSNLSDEDLQNLTHDTQQGILNWAPGGHAIMQVGAGEKFAGIKGRDMSKYSKLMKAGEEAAAGDYLKETDELAKRHLFAPAMHGSQYDSPEERWKQNAPDPADMLKALGTRYGLTDDKINSLLDAHRVGTEGGGAKEVFDIPDWRPGNYESAFKAWMAHPNLPTGSTQGPGPSMYGPPDTSAQFTGGGA